MWHIVGFFYFFHRYLCFFLGDTGQVYALTTRALRVENIVLVSRLSSGRYRVSQFSPKKILCVVGDARDFITCCLFRDPDGGTCE